ncbi:MAG: TonB-dependent receptor [Bacteroidetes bacterium]|nr:TonB-dependent receptor [Bacteroidota bacterium]
MMKNIVCLALFMCLPFTARSNYNYERTEPYGTLKGMVVDAAGLDPLAGVHVIVENELRGTITNTDGHYEISHIPAGVYTIRFQYLGFETRTFTDIVITSNRTFTLDVRLSEVALQGEELTITAGFFSRNVQQPVSRVTFNPEELRRSPGSGQELSRVLAALPGVASGGEVSQDIMVRGGSPNENGFYIDGILMPGVAHFTLPGGSSNGPIGIVNTDLIEDVAFAAGGFGPAYGPFLSSVTDITYREGSRERFQGDVLFSMGGLGLTTEGGVNEGRGSYLFSLRRSYLDLIAQAIGAGGAPRYADVQGKSVYDINRQHRLGTLLVYGNSRFDSSREEALEQGFTELYKTGTQQITSGITHRYIWNQRGFTETAVSYSRKIDDVLGERLADNSISERFDTRHHYTAVRSYSRFHPSREIRVEFGADATLEQHQYDFFIRGGTNAKGEQTPPFERNTNINGLLAGLFTSVTWRLHPMWTVTAGSRVSYTEYGSQWDLLPRLAVTLQATHRLDVSLAYGQYSQPNTRYLMAQHTQNESLKTMHSTHWIGAFGYQLTSETRLTIELYHKWYDRIPEFDVNKIAGQPLPEYIPDNFLSTFGGLGSSGNARAYGVDLLLQKKLARNLYGMASVSLFRSEYRGYDRVWYSRNFDTRQLFNVIAGYRPNSRHEFSMRWSYQGGRPFTPYNMDASRVAGTGVLDVSRFKAERMPAYHSLYVRADRRYFFTRTSLVTFVEVWNAYNRTNIAGYYWSSMHQDVRSSNQFTFLPIGGMKFEF